MNLSFSRLLQVFFLCIGCVVFAGCTSQSETQTQPSPSPALTQESPEASASVEPMLAMSLKSSGSSGQTTELKTDEEGTVYQYTSSNLGLTLNYVSPKQGAMHVLEQNNALCVTYDINDYDCVKGQSVEVFNKEEKATLQVAVAEQLLQDIPKTECYVELLRGGKYSKPKSTFTFAQIAFPNKATSDDPFSLSTAKNCPEKYRATGGRGVRYFSMDKKHPQKFFFFNLGEYAIGSGQKDQTWDETVKFIEEAPTPTPKPL
jgi:hypothetical protein